MFKTHVFFENTSQWVFTLLEVAQGVFVAVISVGYRIGSGRENLPWQEKIQSQYILFLVVWFETRHIKVPIMGKNFPL